MKKPKQAAILWIETVGFTLLIVLSWLTELIRIPHLLFGEAFIRNWERATLRTVVILMVWGCVYWATRRLLKRLHYLEEFLRVCCWCRRACHEGQWLELEEFFSTKFSVATTHGMCPDCLEKKLKEIDAMDREAAAGTNAEKLS